MESNKFGERVIATAHALACSTFANLPSIETEMLDHRVSSQQVFQQHSNNPEVISEGCNQRPRKGQSSTASPFEHWESDDELQEATADFVPREEPAWAECDADLSYELLMREMHWKKYGVELHRLDTALLAASEDGTPLAANMQAEPQSQSSTQHHEVRTVAARRLDQVCQHLDTPALDASHPPETLQHQAQDSTWKEASASPQNHRLADEHGVRSRNGRRNTLCATCCPMRLSRETFEVN